MRFYRQSQIHFCNTATKSSRARCNAINVTRIYVCMLAKEVPLYLSLQVHPKCTLKSNSLGPAYFWISYGIKRRKDPYCSRLLMQNGTNEYAQLGKDVKCFPYLTYLCTRHIPAGGVKCGARYKWGDESIPACSIAAQFQRFVSEIVCFWRKLSRSV